METMRICFEMFEAQGAPGVVGLSHIIGKGEVWCSGDTLDSGADAFEIHPPFKLMPLRSTCPSSPCRCMHACARNTVIILITLHPACKCMIVAPLPGLLHEYKRTMLELLMIG